MLSAGNLAIVFLDIPKPTLVSSFYCSGPSKQPSATQKPAIQSTIIGGSLSTPQVAPVQGASEQRAPEEWPPVQGASLQGASVQRAPEEGPSVQGASVQRAPEEGPSVQGVSRQGASVQGTSEEGSPVQGASLQGTSEQGAPKSLPGTAPRPKPAHAGLRRPLNSVQLNNLAQILPGEPALKPVTRPVLAVNAVQEFLFRDLRIPSF